MAKNKSNAYYAPYDTIKTLLSYLWAFRYRIGFALILMMLAKLATIAVPLILKDIVDTLEKPTTGELVIQLPILLLLTYGGTAIYKFIIQSIA